jgi:hypothetical protein
MAAALMGKAQKAIKIRVNNWSGESIGFLKKNFSESKDFAAKVGRIPHG